MGKGTKIPWAHHTWNPWWGCTKVAPECAFCYAEAQAARFGVKWGAGKPRRNASAKVWGDPDRWNRLLDGTGQRHRVFLGSMMDWADAEVPPEWRTAMWEVVKRCRNLDFLMLTKREPEQVRACLPRDWGEGYPNVWLGRTAGTQDRLDSGALEFAAIPARIHFLSMEPLLERVTLTAIKHKDGSYDALRGRIRRWDRSTWRHAPKYDWVIPGGESGRRARPCAMEWIEDILTEASDAGTPAFVKQLGAFCVSEDRKVTPEEAKEIGAHPDGWAWRAGHGADDPKGEDIDNWPDGFQVREFPVPR
jgi:protein gp37